MSTHICYVSIKYFSFIITRKNNFPERKKKVVIDKRENREIIKLVNFQTINPINCYCDFIFN